MAVPSADPDDLARFGANVRSARERLGLSQMDASLKLDVHVTQLARIETGKRNPSLSTIVKIARGLEVEPSVLLAGL